MKYNAALDALLITTEDAKMGYYLIMYALKKMRESAGLTLDKYEREGMLTEHDSAAIAIIEVAEKMGLHIPVTPHNHNKLDLRER